MPSLPRLFSVLGFVPLELFLIDVRLFEEAHFAEQHFLEHVYASFISFEKLVPQSLKSTLRRDMFTLYADSYNLWCLVPHALIKLLSCNSMNID